MVIEQFEVYLVSLDPTVGHEMGKTRPCVVVSPNEMHGYIRTVLVAPMTSVVRNYPFRVDGQFSGRQGQIALDHMRGVDRSRLAKRVGRLDDRTTVALSRTLVKMFSISPHQK